MIIGGRSVSHLLRYSLLTQIIFHKSSTNATVYAKRSRGGGWQERVKGICTKCISSDTMYVFIFPLCTCEKWGCFPISKVEELHCSQDKRFLPTVGAGSARRLGSTGLHSWVVARMCAYHNDGFSHSCCYMSAQLLWGHAEKRKILLKFQRKNPCQGSYIFWLAQFDMWRLCMAMAMWTDLWTKPETTKRPWQTRGGPGRRGIMMPA